MSFDRLLRPDLPEAQTLHYEKGVVVGWLPAVVTKIENEEDPENLGRIRVKCDLIAANKDLPNDFDGWVWVLEEFVANGQLGGAHRFLQAGSQVALIPMFGDPTKLLMLGAIHSRVDRPNPLFDRSQGVHGSHTPGNVFSIRDDFKSTRTDAYPHGVTQHVSEKGDVIQQTQNKARVHLQHDGTTRVENDKASTVVSAAGSISQRSAGNAIHALSEHGDALLKSAHGSEVNLQGSIAHLTGPSASISQLLGGAKKHLGFLGKAGNLLKQVSQAASLVNGGNLIDLAKFAEQTLLPVTEEFGQNTLPGLDQLLEIKKLPIAHLAQALMPQANLALSMGIDKLLPKVLDVLNSGDIGENLIKLLPKEKISQVLPIVEGLNHSRELQSQFLIDEHLKAQTGKGFSDIENLVGLGLHTSLGKIVEIATQPIPRAFLSQRSDREIVDLEVDKANRQALEQSIQWWIKERTDQIYQLLPKDIQQFVAIDQIEKILLKSKANPDPETLLQEIFKSITLGTVGRSIDSLKQAQPLMQAMPEIGQIVSAIARGKNLDAIVEKALPTLSKTFPELKDAQKLVNNPEALFKQILQPLSSQLQPALTGAMGDFNKVLHAIPKGLPGAVIQATNVRAELQSLFGTHKIFADEGGAGISTPGGGFSLGKAGGLISAIAPLVFKSIGANPAALSLDGKEGITLEGFINDRTKEHPATRISTKDGEIHLQALDQNGHPVHAIKVSHDGIWIDGYELSWLTDLPHRFELLEARLIALETPIAPQNG